MQLLGKSVWRVLKELELPNEPAVGSWDIDLLIAEGLSVISMFTVALQWGFDVMEERE